MTEPGRPTPEQRKRSVAEVFGRTATSYEQVVPFFTAPGRRLVELAGVGRGMTVVDLGAGRGAVTFPAAERVGPTGRVLASDLSPEMVDLLRADVAAAGLRHVEVSVMDAERPELPPVSADRVLGAFLIFFLPDPAAALRRYAEILRPDGRLGLTTFPGTDERWRFWGDLLDEARPTEAAEPDDPGPVGSPERLAATLAETGYRDVEQTEERYDVVFADVDQWWRWVWSQGQRGVLERLPADRLDALRQRAFDGATALREPDGTLRLEQRVTVTVARVARA